MKTLLNIILVVPSDMSKNKMPDQMNGTAWFILGSIVAILLLIYLILTLIKPDKF